jgi:hypothetical protein
VKASLELAANGAVAIDQLRKIVAAWAAGEMDDVEQLIEKAGEWLSDLDEGRDVSEPAEVDAGRQPAPAEATPATIRPLADGAPSAFVALYNAAWRLVREGYDEQRIAELEAAVQGAERFVR